MITIVDYGMGNIGSLENMILRAGGLSKISKDPETIKKADKLILPGVGHFDQAMHRIKELNLKKPLDIAVLERKIPILCICLGAQLVTERSDEGSEAGFGWIKGETVKFHLPDGFRLPHMGWNKVFLKKPSRLFEGISDDPWFYFVHSFHLIVEDSTDILTTSNYCYDFPSALENGNIYALQFHPEKSHSYGLCIIKNFVEM